MSVSIATNPQPASWWQRLTGTEPKTVIKETSTTEVTSVEGGSFNLKAALRNGGIGAAVAGALGGVSLLGKIALPIIGKVGSLGGLVKLAGVGGALGVATAAIPLIAPKVKDSPAAKAALVGAGIGGVAGAILPLMPTWLGAAIGAGVGLLVYNRHNRPAPDYPTYPGYVAYPGYRPMGVGGDDVAVPSGLVPVTPNYGAYAGSAVNPYGYGMNPMPYGTGYGVSPAMPYGYGQSMYGYGMTLPMTAGQQQVIPQAQQVVAQPVATAAPQTAAPKPAGKPKYPNAKTWIDKQGNVRQVGTGKILKAAAGAQAAPAAAAPVATAPAYDTGTSALGQLTSPASYLPGMASSLPMSGMSPLGAGTSGLASLYGMNPQMAAMSLPATTAATAASATGAMTPASLQTAAMPARPTA